MEQYTQRVINVRGPALRWLAIVTGIMVYLPVYLASSKDYLVRESSDYVKDLVLFIISIVIVLACLLVWRTVYKQFKKDRILLGFSGDKSGVALATEIIIEALVAFIIIYLSASKLAL